MNISETELRHRIVIEAVSPEIDNGRFPAKRIAGDVLSVEADIYADGHDIISAVLLYRHEVDPEWTEVPLEPQENDRWSASFTVKKPGTYIFTLTAWVDMFLTWRRNILKKIEAGQAEDADFIEGAGLVRNVSWRTAGKDAGRLIESASNLEVKDKPLSVRARTVSSKTLADLMAKYADRQFAVTYPRELTVTVDREKALFSSWYEMFPRSFSSRKGRHGTFKDCEKMLPYIADMGFDVLYFPPIHPIGSTARKGRNNSTEAGADDPGTPWAIGSSEGGHKSVHPELGTIDDFKHLVKKAAEYGIEIALDIAFQCSPDHPYVKEHPEWFRWRPDGTVQYAENPPKKYQDIYPLEFDSEKWRELWEELAGVVRYWIDQGMRIFRIDNPHTKPFHFWEWMIKGIKREHPDVIFLAEAFTRPKVMYRLAKLGFSQSYTYFTWRNNKWEMRDYMTELTRTQAKEYFRPNFWPNTPDILSDYLRDGGPPAFNVRLILAATLSSNYGIYGPAFELCKNQRKDKESEEYLNSEKYELKHWDIENPKSIKNLISKVNAIRKANPALQNNLSLHFHNTDNDQLLCYSKKNRNGTNTILTVVNFDYAFKQSGWVDLSLYELGLAPDSTYQVYDLLAGAAYTWKGARNYIELDPNKAPAHIFRIDRAKKAEK